jgi:hypothetical protein
LLAAHLLSILASELFAAVARQNRTGVAMLADLQ